ncbi:hypothetical protein GLOIN_2v1637418, partial [Rhizophagus irregularis DAOM 181602=DAOM 197198]
MRINISFTKKKRLFRNVIRNHRGKSEIAYDIPKNLEFPSYNLKKYKKIRPKIYRSKIDIESRHYHQLLHLILLPTNFFNLLVGFVLMMRLISL